VNGSDPREVYDVRRNKLDNLEGDAGGRKPVQAFDYVSVIEGLRDEKIFEDHGRSVLILAHESTLQLALTAVAAGCHTGERRVAGACIHRPGAGGRGEVQGGRGVVRALRWRNARFARQRGLRCGGLERRRLPAHAGAAVEQGRGFTELAHPTELAEGRVDLNLPGADRASE